MDYPLSRRRAMLVLSRKPGEKPVGVRRFEQVVADVPLQRAAQPAVGQVDRLVDAHGVDLAGVEGAPADPVAGFAQRVQVRSMYDTAEGAVEVSRLTPVAPEAPGLGG